MGIGRPGSELRATGCQRIYRGGKPQVAQCIKPAPHPRERPTKTTTAPLTTEIGNAYRANPASAQPGTASTMPSSGQNALAPHNLLPEYRPTVKTKGQRIALRALLGVVVVILGGERRHAGPAL